MGFRWQFEQNSHYLLDNLYSNLTEVFKKPFAGYLLFLVGGADLDILRWIEENIITLDSLTGEDIAFVIFAERFKLKLKSREELGYSDSIGRFLALPNHFNKKILHLDDIKDSYEYFEEITPLVESGQPKWILDDDEITGVTYAVDDIARRLGILNEVPCFLVFDAIPSEKYKILNLNQDNIPELIPLLRNTISNLRNNEGYQIFMAFKKQYSYFEHIKNEKIIILGKIRELNSNKLDSIKEFKNLKISLSLDKLNLQLNKKWERMLSQNRYFLEKAQISRSLKITHFLFSKYSITEDIFETYKLATDKNSQFLIQYAKTIWRLEKLINDHEWPLKEPIKTRYSTVFKYLKKLLGENIKLNFDDVEQCIRIKKLLEVSQSKMIDKILKIIDKPPFFKELPEFAVQELEKSSDQISLIDSKIDDYFKELKYIEQKISQFYELKAKIIQNIPSFIGSMEKAQVDLQLSDGHVKERDIVSRNWFYDRKDLVNFTLLPPQKISIGDTILLKLWIYSENQSQEFSNLLNSKKLEEINYYSTAFSSKEVGEKISFIISIEDLIVENPHHEVRWLGEIAKIDFTVKVPSDTKAGKKKGNIKIFVRALEISEINFSLSVTEEPSNSKLEVEETRFVKAFISYSNKDINKVIGRIQGILKTSPEMEIIMDKKNLRSGDKWKIKLRKFIEDADIFYLFWSKNALESEWVNKEWKCAYKLKGIDFIDPIPLESPDMVPPPDELSDMHFNDWILAYMQSNQ